MIRVTSIPAIRMHCSFIRHVVQRNFPLENDRLRCSIANKNVRVKTLINRTLFGKLKACSAYRNWNWKNKDYSWGLCCCLMFRQSAVNIERTNEREERYERTCNDTESISEQEAELGIEFGFENFKDGNWISQRSDKFVIWFFFPFWFLGLGFVLLFCNNAAPYGSFDHLCLPPRRGWIADIVLLKEWKNIFSMNIVSAVLLWKLIWFILLMGYNTKNVTIICIRY